jgi:glycosyltransferase involved in cell wall biosynthesis
MRILAITNMYPSASFPSQGVFIQEQIKGLRAIGLEMRVLFVDRRRGGPMVYYRMQSKVCEAVAEFEPDVIHVMYGGVMADQIVRHNHICPVVVTYHGSDLLGDNLAGWKRRVISHYGVRCSRRAAEKADGVVVVARHLIGALNGAVAANRVRVIPCGIDMTRFKPTDSSACKQQLGWDPKSFHVLFASSNGDPVKRPWLAKAAVERCKPLGCPAEIHFVSAIPNAEMPLWLNASDALLLTSLHEGSPTIVKEALACDLPVVSVDVGDVAERVENLDGCHLAAADPEVLAEKLCRVWRRGKRLDCSSRREVFSILNAAQKLKRLYDQITRAKKAPRIFPAEFNPGSKFSVPVILRDSQKETEPGVPNSPYQQELSSTCGTPIHAEVREQQSEPKNATASDEQK